MGQTTPFHPWPGPEIRSNRTLYCPVQHYTCITAYPIRCRGTIYGPVNKERYSQNMFDFIKEKLMGVAVDNLDLSKLATSAMEMINSKPKEEVAKATEQAFDSLDQSKKTTLMDGIFGF